MYSKILFIIIISFSVSAVVAQDEAPPQPSPARVALDEARALATAGEADAAVERLEALRQTGFAAVQLITDDPVFEALAGHPGYEALVEAMTAAAYPCEHDERFRAFDFWLGEWDVDVASGQFAGHNRITAEQHGCVLVEEWSSASGGSGMSINYLDAAAGEWVQIWNDASGNQIDIRGGLTDDGMLLEGEIHYVATDTTAPFRGLWTPLEDGRVRQYFEQSNDGGETWTPWFEGFYSRTDERN